jgi:hypothetical protein
MHKNWLKEDQERTHKLTQILYANVIKICYEISVKYQLPKRAIVVK